MASRSSLSSMGGASSGSQVWTHITGQAATYADWVGAYVNLQAIRYGRRDFLAISYFMR